MRFAESAHATNFQMAERADAAHKLVYVYAGRIGCHWRGQEQPLVVPAGALLIVPAGTRHCLVDIEPAVLLLLGLGRRFVKEDPGIAELWGALSQQPPLVLRLSRPTRQTLEALWRRGMAEQATARLGAGVALRAHAAQVLVLLSRLPRAGDDSPADQRVSGVAREIEETFFEAWDLDRAATRAGLSRRRFTALFRAATGRTFWEFLNAHRLAHAARLLRAGGTSVAGVMLASGYNDLSHFYRLFRNRFGVPPRRWLIQAGGPAPDRN
ncbi:AraC family transcriptional regulator [Opitutus sp. ER46]|uniref:helix-turn-helix transcriptional regulator n=1 Tax=Opitutus sp. ER46 TaxID=2161864 RepID=UPI000D30C1EA|nr:AraC family transcriptional regulator [Opitutus sp. ER46]PTX94249.1 hypothetical protein DB354_10815 [Opitutus sp. ER46]